MTEQSNPTSTDAEQTPADSAITSNATAPLCRARVDRLSNRACQRPVLLPCQLPAIKRHRYFVDAARHRERRIYLLDLVGDTRRFKPSRTDPCSLPEQVSKLVLADRTGPEGGYQVTDLARTHVTNSLLDDSTRSGTRPSTELSYRDQASNLDFSRSKCLRLMLPQSGSAWARTSSGR